MCRTTTRNGFTLLEVMIALSIIAIALVTLLSANNRALTMGHESQRLTAATMLAREEMERLSLNTLPKAGSSLLQAREEYPQFRLHTIITNTPFDHVYEVALSIFDAAIEEKDLKEATDVFTLVSYLKQ